MKTVTVQFKDGLASGIKASQYSGKAVQIMNGILTVWYNTDSDADASRVEINMNIIQTILIETV